MPAEPVVHELPMRWADLDSLNHVNNVVYLAYAAESRAMLVSDGLVDTGEPLSIAVDFVRPLLLSRRPVQVVSSSDLDGLTQEIRSSGSEAVFARIVTTFGDREPIARQDGVGEPLPSRVRRTDLDASGKVSTTQMFELFQEARILLLSSRLEGMSAGRFVVAHTAVTFGAPMTWRPRPYDAVSHVSRVGGASVTIESQLVDGNVVMAQCRTTLVGFDLAAQTSRQLTAAEKTAFSSLSR